MTTMLGPKVRIVAIKAMAIKGVVVAMVGVEVRAVVGPIPWMGMSSRPLLLISLKGINQGQLVIISIGLMRPSQKVEFRNYSFQSIA